MVGKKTKQLDHIIDNAFDFLETAIEEFDKKPKYSIMHFSSAVELILKARLVHEHWSLIVIENPEINKFKNGDFRSITINDSIEKIRQVLGEDFPEEFKTSFLEIAKHRNKVVHFFHKELGAASTSITEKVVREQCLGWFHLTRLFEKWNNTFSKYQHKIVELSEKMRTHRPYLVTVYNKVKSSIDKEIISGAIFKVCPSCEFMACKQSTITNNLYTYKCRVCLFDGQIIIINCPQCENPIEILEGDSNPIICSECSSEIDKKYFSEQLEAYPDNDKSEYYENMHINCGFCCTSGAVLVHNDYYICTECRSISQEAGMCGWCSEHQMGGGDLDFSYLSGCEFCEGHTGHTKDD